MNTSPNGIRISQGFFIILVAIFLSACGGSSSSDRSSSSGGGAPSPDPVFNEITALTVTSTAPAQSDVELPSNIKIIAVFNQPMKPETIDGTSFLLQGQGEAPIVGTVIYNPDTLTATFEPGTDLTYLTMYTVTITSAVEDMAGNSMPSGFSWTFVTCTMSDFTAPRISSTSPAHGATNVLRNAKVSVVFNKAIDPDTVSSANIFLTDNATSETVATSLRYVNPTTVVLSPNAPLAASTSHTLTLGGDITDSAGNPLAAITRSFTTGTEVSSSPATVELGEAGNYAILAKSGISTTGTTQITGDIAVSPASRTALTGFSDTLSVDGTFATSPLVTGNLFAADMASPTPDTLITAISDMESAYADAAGRANPHFTELVTGQIGGMTLDPGLYQWGTGVLMTSDVTLHGDADDVWIFQIAGDLKLHDGQAINLSGGARPENVFWQVAGEATLQDGTTFNGIILGQTTIVLKADAVLNGRALSQTATTLISNEINDPTP